MDLADLDAMLAAADAQSAKLQSDYKKLKRKNDGGGKNKSKGAARRKPPSVSTKVRRASPDPKTAVSPRVRQAAKASARSRSPKVGGARKGNVPRQGQHGRQNAAGRKGAAAKVSQNFVNKVRSNMRPSQSTRKLGGGAGDTASLTRAMKRAEALELAKHRRMPSNSSENERSILHTAPGKLQSEKLPSIFSRPKLSLNSGNKRAVVRRPKESALVRKLPSLGK